ncbi:MAG: hypothetical protein M3478_00485 [Planctomycetota bacterium]|nr:hypothetical protein [Planctomycetota bacterium]
MIAAVTQLPVVDGFDLPEPHRRVLRPDEMVTTRDGHVHRLPRFFYAVESSAVAVGTQLTPNFALWEFIEVDLHEPAVLRAYPRFVPCAVTVLATAMEVFRTTVGAPVRIAANGGYRSPAHAGSVFASPHCWATAANVYRIGNDYIDTAERITRYAEVAGRAVAACWTRPSGSTPGEADDHLHLDLGYVTVVPRDASEADRP